MTWTGGSAGFDFKALMPAMKRYLDEHPDLTLEALLTNPPQRQGSLDVGYDGLAVLCEMVYNSGGLAALKAVANTGPQPREVVTTAARLLKVTTASRRRERGSIVPSGGRRFESVKRPASHL